MLNASRSTPAPGRRFKECVPHALKYPDTRGACHRGEFAHTLAVSHLFSDDVLAPMSVLLTCFRCSHASAIGNIR
eukprot:1394441-Amorphochlora_amoeboformis.AAC.1